MMRLKMSSAKWHTFCLGPNVLSCLGFMENAGMYNASHKIRWGFMRDLFRLDYINFKCTHVSYLLIHRGFFTALN